MVIGAVALATVLPIATEGAAAHTSMLSGVAVCQANGTFTVQWTIGNDYSLPVTVTVTGRTPSASSLTGPSNPIAANGHGGAVQSGISGSATSAGLSVRGVWSDGFVGSASNTVSLGGDCHAPATTTTRPATTTTRPATTTTRPRTTTTVAATTTTVAATTTGPPDSVGDESGTAPATLGFHVLGPVCEAELPYISWELTSTGLAPEQNLATITISDINGNVVETLTNQPLVGETRWPGASAIPEDWPGWVKIAGIWYSDTSDAVLRQGVYVQADLAASAGPQLVPYPEAATGCAQPAVVAPEAVTGVLAESGVLPADVPTELPATGSSSPDMLWIATGFVGLGVLVAGLARRKRPA